MRLRKRVCDRKGAARSEVVARLRSWLQLSKKFDDRNGIEEASLGDQSEKTAVVQDVL